MKKALSLVVLTLACMGLSMKPASAGVEDFVINNFSAEYVIDNTKTGGSLLTTENIDLTYSSYNHGILRAVPKSYRGYNTMLHVVSVERDGKPEPSKVESQGDNNIIRIGDAGTTITGAHSYKIVYEQERVINFAGDKQSFYWDVNGTDWKQPFENVSAKVLVKSATYGKQAPQCYTGTNYSQARDCSVSQDGQYAVFSITKPLGPGENMSIELFFDNPVFTQPTWRDTLRDNASNLVWIILGFAGSLTVFIYWLKNGRDYGGSGVIVPEYTPPKNLLPAEVGMLADYTVDGKDISATIIDLAVRGYLKIHDDTSKVLFVKRREFSLELVNADMSKLKSFEAAILTGIFSTLTVGTTVALSDVSKSKLRTTVEGAKVQIKSELESTYGLIESKSLNRSGSLIAVGAILIFSLAFIHFNVGYIIGMALFAVACFVFAMFMPRRSHAGVEMYEKIQGLKLYMNTAENDRLKMMQSVDRPYAEPSKTVDLFEKLLPYAVALGVEKSWAKQFDDILSNPPDWYTGNNLSSFNAGYLASSLSASSRAFSSSVESSSGSSGGSGGGGGGGGGGGW